MRLIYLLVFLPIITFLSCNTTGPTAEKTSISLSIEDVSYTEAWLRLSSSNISLPVNILIMKNGNDFINITITGNDTTIYDSTLSPISSYTFQAVVSNSETKSKIVDVVTKDITTSNYQMTTWTFGGDNGSCSFNDVAIINNNDIWAAGEIIMQDSLGQYYWINAAHWDGYNWNLVRVPAWDGQFTTYDALTGVIAFSDTSVWFSSGGFLIKWDGKKFETRALFAETLPFMGHVNKIWGTDENNIYCVGDNGYIFNYYGTGWRKIESGTNLRIADIWGDFNNETNQWEVLAVASGVTENIGKKVIQVIGDKTIFRQENGLDWYLTSIWFNSGKKYYIGGGGLFIFNNIKNEIDYL